MEDTHDDFGELYADIQLQPNFSINGLSHFSQFCSSKLQQLHRSDDPMGVDERRENDLNKHNDENNEVGVKNVSETEDEDDDDDFDVFVNDEDIGAKNGGGDATRCSDEMAENVEGDFSAGVMEGKMIGKNQIRVDVDGVEQSGGGNGGERGSVPKNGSNLQCKYSKRNGSVIVGNQRAISSWKAEREDAWYSQQRMSGFVPGLAGNGNSFWLPWYRTILDVDIDTIDEKAWTCPGADATDYFNYGFDEESWKSYCQSLDQSRRQMLSQTRNQVKESLNFKLKKDSGAIKEIQSDEFVDGQPIQIKQIGQAIHVEDSNTERQPSTDARRPRVRDSDVIEITMQDPDEPASSGNEDLYNTLQSQCNMSEERCDPWKSEPKAEQPDGSKAYEMGKSSTEEAFRGSSVSSDSKRSNESAAVSSHELQHSNGQGKDQNSELDIEPFEKVGTSSRGNPRAIVTVNSSMKDVDSGSGTTEANQCVAGIDLSFDDHGLSSRSPSYFDTCSETSQDHNFYSRRNQDLRRSSPDSKKEKFQVADDDYQHSRRNRGDKNMKDGYKYSLRVRNSIKENSKHDGLRVGRHEELKDRSGRDDYIRNRVVENNYVVDSSRARHHVRSEERRRPTSDDEYWSGYRENELSPSSYDRRFVESRFQGECMRDFDQRDQWGSRDGVDMYFQRDWEDKRLSDRRMRRMKDVVVKNDWRVEERECIITDEKPNFRKFSSSRDINFFKQQSVFDDIDFNKRNSHRQPLQCRYADEPVRSRFASSNPLDDRQRERVASDIKHERRSWQSRREVGTFIRGDEFFESSLDVGHPQYTVDDGHWNTQISTSTHDFRDVLRTYDERRHQPTLFREDTEDLQSYRRYERHSNSISSRKGSSNRHVYDHRVAYNREDSPRYLDEDDYIENRQNGFHPISMSSTEDTLFDGCSDNVFRGESMLDCFNGVPSRKWHGLKRGIVRGGKTMHKQIMRGRFGVVGCGKSYSKTSTRANLEENGLRGRNLVELHHTVREIKSTGIFTKAGIVPNNNADGRFREQFKRRRGQDGAFPDKIIENKTRNIEASWESLPAENCANASELEEGQLLTEEPRTEIPKVKKYSSGHLAQKDSLKGRLGHNQMIDNNDHVYDENRILETMAKMEKRRERFKEPVILKKETDSDPKPEEGKLIEMIESKGQRPTRKRKWC